MSDSEESTKSNAPSETGSSCNNNELSLVAEFDDLQRLFKQQRCDEVEDTFLHFVEQSRLLLDRCITAEDECVRLRAELDKKIHDINEMECQFQWARKLLDQEKKNIRQIKKERDDLDDKMSRAANILFDNQNRLPEDTRQQLTFLNTDCYLRTRNSEAQNPLSTIPENNLTESLISNFSYSRSEDDLDISALPSRISWKNHRQNTGNVEEPAFKKRRSGNSKVVEINTTETVRATTTLTVNKDGPITATSVIESIPSDPTAPPTEQQVLPSAPPAHLIDNLWQQESPQFNVPKNFRKHSFQTKTIVIPEFCNPCNKRIRFGKTVLKCKECRAVCHPECKDFLPLPCIPMVNTPQKGSPGVIADFTPTIPPMVPALIVHCVNEIELRGMKELGIYRIPGSEKDVKALKEKLLRGKNTVNLSQIDIHVICGTVKDFLRSLHEPLVTHIRWTEFVRAVEAKDELDIAPALYQLISELPQPNRDTLAYMVGHLKRVANVPEPKMTIKNLAKVFGPTIVGYSSNDPNPTSILNETRLQCVVMEHLLNLPSDYWSSFVNNNNYKSPMIKMQQTPSMDSLVNSRPRGLFSPYGGIRSARKKNQKLFS